MIFSSLGLQVLQATARTSQSLYAELGFTVSPAKMEGPCSTLGIEIGFVSGEIRLPHEELSRLFATLQQWISQSDST